MKVKGIHVVYSVKVGDVITALVLASSLLESLPAFLGPSTICLRN